MSLQSFFMIFTAVFLAELGDKTQLATLLFATDSEVNRWTVFLAASTALIVSSAIGVLAGAAISEYLNVRILQAVAGTGFVTIGLITLWGAMQSS